MHKLSYYLVNAITFYRMTAAFVMVFLIINHQFEIFKWLLVISFFTDAIDGFLARDFKVTSKFGSKIDSISDDLTVAAAIVGIAAYKPDFLSEQITFVGLLLSLYILQIAFAVMRYGKISGFHTYLAKVAAVLQGVFLLCFFFFPKPFYLLFYVTAIITMLDLIEEIILVLISPKWKANVKGLYWVMRSRINT